MYVPRIHSKTFFTRYVLVDLTSFDGSRICELEDCYSNWLHMCFDRFLLAFESRDLSQADKSITRAQWLDLLLLVCL